VGFEVHADNKIASQAFVSNIFCHERGPNHKSQLPKRQKNSKTTPPQPLPLIAIGIFLGFGARLGMTKYELRRVSLCRCIAADGVTSFALRASEGMHRIAMHGANSRN
jgi:hypothetical protein